MNQSLLSTQTLSTDNARLQAVAINSLLTLLTEELNKPMPSVEAVLHISQALTMICGVQVRI